MECVLERDGKLPVIPIEPKWIAGFVCLYPLSIAQGLGSMIFRIQLRSIQKELPLLSVEPSVVWELVR